MSDLVIRIEQCIKGMGSNFKRVEEACGLGNGTIKRWSQQSPRLDKLKAVSEYLQVSLDYLVYGCNEPSSFHGDLSELETHLIEMFRLLDNRGKEDSFDFIAMQYKKLIGEKGSIYLTYTSAEGGPEKNDKQLSSEISSGTA